MTSKTIADYLEQEGFRKRTYEQVCDMIKAESGGGQALEVIRRGYSGPLEEKAYYRAMCMEVEGQAIYDLLKSRFVGGDLEWIFESVSEGISNQERVLDVGCGTGLEICFLGKQTQGEVVGIDFSPEMIERANARAKKQGLGNVKAYVGDRDGIKYDGEFDRVICVNGIVSEMEFIGIQSEMCFGMAMIYRFERMKKALKPGGRLKLIQGVDEGAEEFELSRFKGFAEYGGFSIDREGIFKNHLGVPLVDIFISARA